MPPIDRNQLSGPCHPEARRPPRRSPIRRILKWLCAIACSLLMTLFIVSIKWIIDYTPQSNNFTVYLHDGGVIVYTLGLAGYVGTGLHIEDRGGYDFPSEITTGLPRNIEYGPFPVYLIPLWLPLVVLMAMTAILFYFDRSSIPPGHCKKCGYNLTGNVSGVCPECGTPIRKAEMEELGQSSDG